MSVPTKALDELEASRRRAEERLRRLRRSIQRETGWTPTAKSWLLPLTAFACGLALAARGASRRRELGGGDKR